MADVWANSMACHPRATYHIAGAATWWIHCHDSRATSTLQGVRIPSAILKIVFRHILFFCFLIQFRLWRAATFVSSPIHLFYIHLYFTKEMVVVTRSPASAGIANRPLVFLGIFLNFRQIVYLLAKGRSSASRCLVMGVATHNIEYICLNLFTLRRFNNNESSGSRQIRYGATGGDAPRLGWWNLASR